MQNISFQGKSNLFFSKEAVLNAEKHAKSTYRHINPQNNSCNISKGKIFTAPINQEYLTVVVRNDNDGFLTSVPIFGSTDETLHNIGLKLYELQTKAKNKLTAWIIGGIDSSKDKGKTMDAVNKVADILCDKPDIDSSILTGIKNNENIFAMHNSKDFTQIAISAKNAEELENMFELVELNNVYTLPADLNTEIAKKVFQVKK